jgi:hypothetical protein
MKAQEPQVGKLCLLVDAWREQLGVNNLDITSWYEREDQPRLSTKSDPQSQD